MFIVTVFSRGFSLPGRRVKIQHTRHQQHRSHDSHMTYLTPVELEAEHVTDGGEVIVAHVGPEEGHEETGQSRPTLEGLEHHV